MVNSSWFQVEVRCVKLIESARKSAAPGAQKLRIMFQIPRGGRPLCQGRERQAARRARARDGIFEPQRHETAALAATPAAKAPEAPAKPAAAAAVAAKPETPRRPPSGYPGHLTNPRDTHSAGRACGTVADVPAAREKRPPRRPRNLGDRAKAPEGAP